MKNRIVLMILMCWLLMGCAQSTEPPVTAMPAPPEQDTAVPPTTIPVTVPLPEITLAPSTSPSLVLLPRLATLNDYSGGFPEGVSWQLGVELPESETAVPVIAHPQPGGEPISAADAAALASRYGFSGDLFVEWRPDLPLADAAASGLFLMFADSQTIAINNATITLTDAAALSSAPPPSFDLAATIAAQYLLARGWLPYAYQMRESELGEGVLFFPQVNGRAVALPAFAVRVAASGQVQSIAINTLDMLSLVGRYPIIGAEDAWQQLQANPDAPGIFYSLTPPATDLAPSLPTFFQKKLVPGAMADVYTILYGYQPASGGGELRIATQEFGQITGDAAMLDELAAGGAGVVHLWGEVLPPEERPILRLAGWEALPDVGSLALVYGTLQSQEGQRVLLGSDGTTYLLPDAPEGLPLDAYADVYGMPLAADENGRRELSWQSITVYPALPQEEWVSTPLGSIQQITITEVALVYRALPAYVTGWAETLSVPVWQFTGTADTGEGVHVWVTAVQPEWLNTAEN